MNSDLVTKWTAIITNIAVVIGLIFVGLEFENSTKAIESERVDVYAQGWSDTNIALMENKEFFSIWYRAYTDTASLSDEEVARMEIYLNIGSSHFTRMYLAHESGLLPDALWEDQKAIIGFAFLSTVGRNVLYVMSATNMGDDIWELIKQSTQDAEDYCNSSQDKCMDVYTKAALRL
jgi:hypothetical protein